MKARESIPVPLRLTLSGSSAVHDATLAARKFAESAGVGQADVAHLAIVVEELVTNLYDHGGLTTSDTFDIGLSASLDEVAFLMVTPGAPFSPGRAISSPGAASRGGGAGLRLVQTWSGQIEHQYRDGHNEVTLILPMNRKD